MRILAHAVSFAFCAVNLCAVPSYGYAEEENVSWRMSLCKGLDTLLTDELLTTSQLGLCVFDLTADEPLYAFQARQRMRPASTEKIVTAVTALSELGSGCRFTTSLRNTGKVEGRVLWGDLYVVGGFDPWFGEEDMEYLCRAVKTLGIDSVAGGLYADVSMKDTLQWGWGWCWDDDMPLLTPLLYNKENRFMDAFCEALREWGVGYSFVGKARCPDESVCLSERSRSLAEVLDPMMKKSDNLCAEALFYKLASLTGKPYASRREAMYYIEGLIGRMGYDAGRYTVADGSGVSLYNYLSAELETAFLRYAYRDEQIFIPLYQSLPVAGVDGTLRRRMQRGAACNNVRAKTGTLEGVSTLAGYARASNGRMLAFCIMNQGVENRAAAHHFQDKVCDLLCR